MRRVRKRQLGQSRYLLTHYSNDDHGEDSPPAIVFLRPWNYGTAMVAPFQRMATAAAVSPTPAPRGVRSRLEVVLLV